MRRALIVAVPALALLLQACSMTPDYSRPAAPVQAAWPTGEAYPAAETVATPALPEWESFYRDPALRGLISRALENNRDLRVAALNVQAYQAQYRIQRADLFPGFDGQASGARQRTPADLSPMGGAAVTGQYSVGAALSYELDLFGRVRSLNQSALESYLASEAARRSVHISLIASVAEGYLVLQADRALLDLTRDTRDAYAQTSQLMRDSERAGVASALEVRQAQTAVDEANAQLCNAIRG